MRWLVKVAAANALSLAPGGGFVYQYIQERVTRRLRVTRSRVLPKMNLAADYLGRLVRLRSPEWLLSARSLDIGCGAVPTIPLLLAAAGVPHQMLVDIAPLLKRQRLVDLVAQIDLLVSEVRAAVPPGLPLRPLPDVGPSESLDDYLGGLGITYRAPFDAGAMNLEDESFDLVMATSVLQYPPRAEVEAIVREAYRILSPRGCFVVQIYLCDQYALDDPRISSYNFLRFSDFVWEHMLNSPLFGQNRLRARDYLRVFEQVGLRIADLDLREPGERDLEDLRRLRLHTRWQQMSPRDVAIKELFAVLEK